MFLVSALTIFIATSAYLQLIFLLVEEVILKEWGGKWSESHSYSVTESGLQGPHRAGHALFLSSILLKTC